MVLLLLLCPWWGQAAIRCDGVDDDVTTGTALSSFMSAATGALVVSVKPTVAAVGSGTSHCYDGERLFVDFDGATGNMGLQRNGNLGGNDRVCATNWSGSEQYVESAYTLSAWTTLAWVHSGGQLFLYKDGLPLTSVSSGNTSSLTSPLRLCTGGLGVVPAQGIIDEAWAFSTPPDAATLRSMGQGRVRRLSRGTPTGYWPLDDCGLNNASGNGVALRDATGLGHPMTANHGADAAGMLCRNSDYMSFPWGVID